MDVSSMTFNPNTFQNNEPTSTRVPSSPSSSQFGSFFSTQNNPNNLNFNQINFTQANASRTGHITPPTNLTSMTAAATANAVQQTQQNQQNLLNQLNLNLNLNIGSGSPNRNPVNQFPFRNSSSQQITNKLQQQMKLANPNSMSFNNLNTISTLPRPQSANTTDSTFSPLDPSDFPVLNRNQSPFQSQQQQQQQQIVAQRSSTTISFHNSLNQPQSAPILTAQQQANIQNFTSTNLLQQQHQQQQQQQHNFNLMNNSPSNTMPSNSQSKMWSSFGSVKDNNSMRLLNLMKHSQNDSPHEFQMQQEDFPALPRTKNTQSVDSNEKLFSSADNLNKSNLNTPLKKGLQILPDGRIINIPPNMLKDQFGIAALYTCIKADREKDVFTFAFGSDLTALGLNLNSVDNLYHSFLSPFSDIPCRLQDIDYPVPSEYIVNSVIKEKLSPIDLNRYSDDLLFYLFYMNGGDILQLKAAEVLYERDWRYHIEKRVWLTKVQGLEPQQKTQTFEKGYYIIFDVTQWKQVQMEMTIEYSKLADKPQSFPPYQRSL